ncbi:MAG TPA: tetratricopeptide repeat protein [bacterium]|nr:tetratricopeptide repeat protein [bacterium]
MGEKVPAALKRRAQLYLADILREKGDFSAARKEYERLTETKLFEMRSGYHARNVLDALKNRDASTALERLNAWAEELPAVKLRGHWSVLFARANLLRRDYQSAWHELDLFLRGCQEKDNPYLVWALSLAAEAQEGLGNRVRAEEYYRRIIKEYPHHQLASVAADRLKSP